MAGGYSAGSASVQIVPDFSNAQRTIGAWFAQQNDLKIKVVPDLDNTALARLNAALPDHHEVNVDFDSDRLVRGTMKVMDALTGLSTVAGVAAKAFGPASLLMVNGAGALISIASAASAAAPALLTLPAAAIGAGAGIAVLTIGMKGLGEAFKASGDPEKFAAAMAKLAPAARDLVTQIQALKPAWEGLRLDVQQQLFEGIGTSITKVAKVSLPVLREGLAGVATEMNVGLKAMMGVFAEPKVVTDFAATLGFVRDMWHELAGAAAPFTRGFLDLVTVGAQYLPMIGALVRKMAEGFAAWVSEARATGTINEMIRTAFDLIGKLVKIVTDLAQVVGDVFLAALPGGTLLIGVLGQLIDGFAKITGSDLGRSSLGQFFDNIAATMQILAPAIEKVVGALLIGLLPAMSGLLTAIAPVAADLLGQIADMILTLAPLFYPALATAVAAMLSALAPLIPMITTLGEQLFPIITEVLIKLAPVISEVALAVGEGLLAGVTALLPYIPMLADALIWVVNAIIPFLPLLASLVPIIWLAIQAFGPMVAIIKGVIFVVKALQLAWALLQLAWAFSPLGVIIIALVALGAALVLAYKHSETFRDIVQAALQKVAEVGQWMWETVLRPVWTAMQVGWDAVLTAIRWAYDNILKPTWDALTTAARFLWNDVLKPAFDGIMVAWNAMITGIKWAWDNILAPLWAILKGVAEALAIFLLVVIFAPIMLAWKVMVEGMKLYWDIVLHPMWVAVETAANWLWNNVLLPVWNAMNAAWSALLTAIKWAWDNILHPTWVAIEVAANWLWNNVCVPIWNAMNTAWTALLTAFKWAWDNILHPTWVAIETAANWLWANVLVPIWNAMNTAWSALLTAIRWAYDNILHPTWLAVETAAKYLWNNVLVPVFGAILTAWDNMSKGFQVIYNNVLKPVFDWFRALLEDFKTGFANAVDWLGRTWESLKGKLMGPIQWVVDFVWNQGLMKLWNTINDLWGGEDKKPFTLNSGGAMISTPMVASELAAGGILPGYTPGRDVHEFYSPTGGRLSLSGGEAVMRPEFTAAMGVHGINMLNAAARTGGVQAVANAMAARANYDQYQQHHASGGIIDLPGWLDVALKLIPGMGGVRDAIKHLAGSQSPVGQLGDGLVGAAKNAGTEILNKIKSWFDGLANSGGAGVSGAATPNGANGLGPAALRAREYVMKTYGITNIGGFAKRNIAGTGTPSDHSTGHAIDIMLTPNYNDPAKRLLGQTIAEYFRANPGAFGTKYVIYYDRIANGGAGWTAYHHPGGGTSDTLQHRDHVHVSVFAKGGILEHLRKIPQPVPYDTGGWLPPGITTVYNGTGRPEPVLNARDHDALMRAATPGMQDSRKDRPLLGDVNIYAQQDRATEIMDELWHRMRVASRGGVYSSSASAFGRG